LGHFYRSQPLSADFGAHRGEFLAAVAAEYPMSRGCFSARLDPALAGWMLLSHSGRNAHVENSYSSPSLLRAFNDLLVAVLLFDFVPESRDLAATVLGMLNNFMEGDNPACPGKRGISEKVAFYSFIGVITIDKKKVQRLSNALDLGEDLF
jgi:hypothetical protein